jgi:hypothetical protein
MPISEMKPPLVLGGGRRVSARLAGHQRVCGPVEPVRRGCGCRVSDIRERSRALAGPTRRVAMGRHHGAGCRRSAPGWIHGGGAPAPGSPAIRLRARWVGARRSRSCWGSYGTPRRTAAAFSCCGSCGCSLVARRRGKPSRRGLTASSRPPSSLALRRSATAIPSPFVTSVAGRCGCPCDVMRGCRTRACARR